MWYLEINSIPQSSDEILEIKEGENFAKEIMEWDDPDAGKLISELNTIFYKFNENNKNKNDENDQYVEDLAQEVSDLINAFMDDETISKEKLISDVSELLDIDLAELTFTNSSDNDSDDGILWFIKKYANRSSGYLDEIWQ